MLRSRGKRTSTFVSIQKRPGKFLFYIFLPKLGASMLSLRCDRRINSGSKRLICKRSVTRCPCVVQELLIIVHGTAGRRVGGASSITSTLFYSTDMQIEIVNHYTLVLWSAVKNKKGLVKLSQVKHLIQFPITCRVLKGARWPTRCTPPAPWLSNSANHLGAKRIMDILNCYDRIPPFFVML